ncbi:hypothetical protein [Reyranella sp.]|uniref:hypothetical protein n=1 Tax=Reyranella sp. TaxID=1929291 RepID=UPI003D0E85ED
MPLQWTIDHSKKFVHIVVLDGPLTLKDMEEHFDAIAVADAMGYAKLFDATRFQPVYSDDDVMMMGARLSAYTATLESGPLAVFGTDPALEFAFRRFTNVSPSQRPAALFRTEAGARAWLAEKAAARMAPPQGPILPKKPQTRLRKKQ